MSEYTEKVERTLTAMGIKYSAHYLGNTIPPFWGDNKYHATYRVIFAWPKSVKTPKLSFKFYQSIDGTAKGEVPTSYDVLAALTKNDPGSFQDFISAYGYEEFDPNTGRMNGKTMRLYKAVVKEYEKVSKFFSPSELEMLSEIAV